ncbi:MAG: hypothetical protein AAF555_05670 [Verrucomicrobiota bacterium]
MKLLQLIAILIVSAVGALAQDTFDSDRALIEDMPNFQKLKQGDITQAVVDRAAEIYAYTPYDEATVTQRRIVVLGALNAEWANWAGKQPLTVFKDYFPKYAPHYYRYFGGTAEELKEFIGQTPDGLEPMNDRFVVSLVASQFKGLYKETVEAYADRGFGFKGWRKLALRYEQDLDTPEERFAFWEKIANGLTAVQGRNKAQDDWLTTVIGNGVTDKAFQDN